MRDSIDEGLTSLDMRIRFRDDFRSWGEKSFGLLHPCVQGILLNFLRERRALSDDGFRRKIAPFLAEVVETETPMETELRQLMAIRHEWQRQRSRRTPRFPMHTQQARPAPRTDLQPPPAHRHLRQLSPKVTESQIPSTYAKKSLHVLRVPPLQPQPVPQEKLLPPQLLHETPRPTLIQQDLAGIPHVKITAGSHLKPESAPVDKAVTNLANELVAEPNYDTPGGDEEDDSFDPSKSAAVRPFDDSPPTILAAGPRVEPEQHPDPDKALDRGAPTDEEETSRNEDSADAEKSDGLSGDQVERVKEILRGEFAPATYMLSPVQGSFWSPPASKLLTNTMTLVDHLFTDFENYFRLVERLVP
ncbi:hypothetical protein E4U38_000908 [Claviceps purpurea]|nr:hypothetical protein E4U38_000908 [Claviceps purpurea]